MGKYFPIRGTARFPLKRLSKLPILTRFGLLGGLGCYKLESHSRQGCDVDDGPHFDRSVVQVNGILRLGQIDRNRHPGADDDRPLLHVKSPSLERARRSKNRRDKPPAAGNRVDLPRFHAQAGVDQFPERPRVWTRDLQIHLIIGIRWLEDHHRILRFDHFSAG